MPLLCRFAILLFVAPALLSAASAADTFAAHVRPILATKCLRCHGPKEQNAEVRLDTLSTDLVKQPLGADTWHDALNAINKGEMPPEDEPALTIAERALTGWIAAELERLRRHRKSTGSQVVMRRLNRFEYQNTMTDLLGLQLDYSQYLPPDPLSDDGFQNNGASLRMSAMQLEYYLKAARDGLRRAIVEGPAPEVFEHTATETVADKGKGNWTNRLGRTGRFVARVPEFPDEGEFVIRVKARAEMPAGSAFPVMQVRLGFRADVSAPARQVGVVDVPNAEAAEFEFRARLEEFPIQSRSQSKYPGMLIWIDNVYSDGRPAPKPKQVEEVVAGRKKKRRKTVWEEDPEFPKVIVEAISFKAPVFRSWPPEYHTAIIPRQPEGAADERVAARESLQTFLPRAFRRPIDDCDLEPVLGFFDVVRPTAHSFEAAMREVIAMTLVSAEFLYIAEPQDDGRRLNDFEVASRLSYFLWSTMPDSRLFEVAAAGQLLRREVVRAEVDRMLRHPRSDAFVRQFTSQWLDLSGIDRVAVNPEFYPDFDNGLKPHLRQETQQFFGEILRSNVSALGLIDANFTVLNEPLARHYGIGGPRGTSFERVQLSSGSPRGGVLGQGSFLLANSTGDDSHPIKRAVWIRERLLDDPPAPPPPDVPDLNQELPELTALPLKKQLELHLENEACAACHREIDPWGVALERFDAIGLRRDVIRRPGPGKRREFVEYAIDTKTQLPDGSVVDGFSDLKSYLVSHKSRDFSRTLVVKLLSYALGRSLEFDDEAVVDDLTDRFVKSGYKLRSLISDIACCELFVESAGS